MSVNLRLDWCSYEAAKYAVEHWHYSRSLPTPPLLKIGVWEEGEFIGCVMFSRGASSNLLKPYNLKWTEGCELTRIALNTHRTPVSRIVRIAIDMLRKSNPGLQLIISFADPNHGHIGSIYQAMNWIYTGTSTPNMEYYDRAGKRWHSRQVSKRGFISLYGEVRRCPKPSDCQIIRTEGKHRYLYPLNNDMRNRILSLQQSYPKRATSENSDTSRLQREKGGAAPTVALNES
jgi:hypothetical protein